MSKCSTQILEIVNQGHIVSISDESHSVSIGGDNHSVSISDDNHSVSITEESYSVSIGEDCPVVVEVPSAKTIIQIPNCITINNGIDPVSGEVDNICCEVVAAGQINVNRVVALLPDGTVEHADKDNPNHYCNIFGVSSQSAPAGSLVKVVKFGILAGAAIGAIGDNFFLGIDGQLSSLPPTTGSWVPIGQQQSTNAFFVKIEEAIILN